MRFVLCTGGVFILDQITKFLALKFLNPNISVEILPQLFSLKLVSNSGAAFSMFREHTIVLTLFTSIASIIIIWWGIKLPQGEKMMQVSLGLIAGGALGNLFDRFFRGGLVVDFLDFHWFNRFHWPTFNIADTGICIGVGLIILDTLILRKKSHIQQPAPKKT